MEPDESWKRDEQNPYVRGELVFVFYLNFLIETSGVSFFTKIPAWSKNLVIKILQFSSEFFVAQNYVTDTLKSIF